MNYASGTWKLTKEHERMIQSTQRKMLRLIIQTKRRHKKIAKQKDETKESDDTKDLCSTEDENEDGQSSNTHSDQDSDISFESDTDDEIDTTENEEVDWIEDIKRSTDEVIDKMEDAKIRCWIKTHKRMTWRMALRIASLPNERWMVKAAEWNPELRRRWEDDSNEFLKLEENETENSTERQQIMDQSSKRPWKMSLLEKDYVVTVEERSENKARHRWNQSRPARYVNGGRLSDDEVASIT